MTKNLNAERAQLQAVMDLPAHAGRQIAYGTHPDQVLELHGTPASAQRCIVLLHGGYFRQAYDRAHLRRMAQALAQRGALVVLAEYRRAGGAGGHPHTLQDVSAAIACVFRSLPDWSMGEQAMANVTVAGHSAGGCLALSWASWQPADGPPIRLRPLSPISDLLREANEGLANGAVLDYMGVRPVDDLKAYLAEDPRSRAACIPERMAVRILHGTEDGIVDIGFSRNFPAERIELDGAGHFDLVDPGSRYFEDVARALLD